MDHPELVVNVLGAGACRVAAIKTDRGPRIRLTVLDLGGAEKASIDMQEAAVRELVTALDAAARGMRAGLDLAHDDES